MTDPTPESLAERITALEAEVAYREEAKINQLLVTDMRVRLRGDHTTLVETLGQREAQLRKHGGHTDGCPCIARGMADCTCGWAEIEEGLA